MLFCGPLLYAEIFIEKKPLVHISYSICSAVFIDTLSKGASEEQVREQRVSMQARQQHTINVSN